ncbi:hypothetical protein HDV00_008267 [Rhizophlyctis rosea]|nr:hypothetical protein HDV00_008267 [Rhizophlyctis rosea]
MPSKAQQRKNKAVNRARSESQSDSSARSSTTETVGRAQRAAVDAVSQAQDRAEPFVQRVKEASRDVSDRAKSEARRAERRVRERANGVSEGTNMGNVLKTLVVLGVLGVLLAVFGTDLLERTNTKGRIARAPAGSTSSRRGDQQTTDLTPITSAKWSDILSSPLLASADPQNQRGDTDFIPLAIQILHPPTTASQSTHQRRSQEVESLSDISIQDLASTDPLLAEKIDFLHATLQRRQSPDFWNEDPLLIGDSAIILQNMAPMVDQYWDPKCNCWVNAYQPTKKRRRSVPGTHDDVLESARCALKVATRTLSTPGAIDREGFEKALQTIKDAESVRDVAAQVGC